MTFSSLDEARLVISNLGIGIPALYLMKRLGYIDHFYYLTAAIDRLAFPRVRSDIHLEEAGEADFSEILRGIGRWDATSRKDILARFLFHRRGVRSCYIGRDAARELVSMQWLIRPRSNGLLEQRFHGLYYPLKEDEVMIENIFVFPPFRGLGAFSTTNHGVLALARQEGFRVCHTYIRKDNIASLTAYLNLGFRIRRLLTGYNLAGISWRNLDGGNHATGKEQ